MLVLTLCLGIALHFPEEPSYCAAPMRYTPKSESVEPTGGQGLDGQWRGVRDEMVHASAGNSSFHSLMTVQCGTHIHPPPLANMADNDTSRRMVTRPKNTSTCPIVIYEQFKFFFNLYCLLVTLSQFVPAFRT
ncbi:hypothetical protein F5888DRAFT_1667194, partial [Russula emetica]